MSRLGGDSQSRKTKDPEGVAPNGAENMSNRSDCTENSIKKSEGVERHRWLK